MILYLFFNLLNPLTDTRQESEEPEETTVEEESHDDHVSLEEVTTWRKFAHLVLLQLGIRSFKLYLIPNMLIKLDALLFLGGTSG